MKNLRRRILLPIIAVLVLYRIGPEMKLEKPNAKLPQVLFDISSVDNFVKEKESLFNIKKNNEARIIWADSIGKSTDYVLLYLHGFSASWYEGYPVNNNFVEHFGCNAYYARLAEHGLQTDQPLLQMTPERLYDSAKEALLIAKTIGKKVIIMSCSTGGTLSLMLAAEYPDLVDGLLLYSPNIEIRQGAAKLLSQSWGLKIAELSEGGNMRHVDGTPLENDYWYLNYRVEAMVYLQQLLDEGMNQATFEKVKCPVFLGYYYKDKKNQDDVVSVEAMLGMYEQLGSTQKQKQAFPDAGRHTIAFIEGPAHDKVTTASIAFAKEHLGMQTSNDLE